MFQRLTSALFGDEEGVTMATGRPTDGEEEREEDDEWILVNYLAESSSDSVCPDDDDDEEEEDEMVMVPSPRLCSAPASPRATPPIRYASCTSLNSTADTDTETEAETETETETRQEEEEEEEEESGFHHLASCALDESWFVTPPPCFTGRYANQPVALETSPLENLLIEHPSMSVYAFHHHLHKTPLWPPRLPQKGAPRLGMESLPRALDLELGLGLDLDLELGLGLLPGDFLPGDLLPGNMPSVALTTSGGKEKGRRSLDGSRHRPEAVAVVQRRSGLHSACYAAALVSTRPGLLQGRHGNATQRTHQPSSSALSRNALRRHNNLMRPSRTGALQLHQPSSKHLHY